MHQLEQQRKKQIRDNNEDVVLFQNKINLRK
jgi:hypothetical protein